MSTIGQPGGISPRPTIPDAGAAATTDATTASPTTDREPVLSGVFTPYPELEAVFAGTSELGRGSTGEAVQRVQEALYRAGIPVRGGFDGVFGRGTETAIATFQRGKGLDPSGRLDRATLIALQDSDHARVLPAPDPLTGHRPATCRAPTSAPRTT